LAWLVTVCTEEAQGPVMTMVVVTMQKAAQGTSLLHRCDSTSLRGETICGPQDKVKRCCRETTCRPVVKTKTKKKPPFVLFSFLKCRWLHQCKKTQMVAPMQLWTANHSTGAKASSPGGTSSLKEKALPDCTPRQHKTIGPHRVSKAGEKRARRVSCTQ